MGTTQKHERRRTQEGEDQEEGARGCQNGRDRQEAPS